MPTRRTFMGVLGLAIALSWHHTPTVAAAGPGTILKPAGELVADSYIVVLKDEAIAPKGTPGPTVPLVALDAAVRHGGTLRFVYQHALKGFSIRMPERAAQALANDPRVKYVVQNSLAEITATQTSPPSWGLDRIDQRDLPRNDSYTYNLGGWTIHAYILDTGIMANHPDLSGRVSPDGFTAFTDEFGTSDCHGHGTHVAGIVGGTTFGVAKGVTLHPVRVAYCNGFGSAETVAAGVDWVTGQAIRPAVANMSLRLPMGCPADAAPNPVIDEAVSNSIASGVTYVVGAGNCGAGQPPASRDACNFSPAHVPEALTIGAADMNDAVASFSSQGPCVDLFAPGVGIRSAWNDGGDRLQDGTSQATPHVAGIAALYLNEAGNVAPSAVHSAIVASATPDKLTGFLPEFAATTPNRLAFSLFGAADRIQFRANYVWTRTGYRRLFSSTRENPGEFHFFYFERLGNFEQRPGGACNAGQNNPTYLYVQVYAPLIQSCRWQGSWDNAPVECPPDIVTLLNRRTWVTLNTDQYQTDPSTCTLFQPARSILPFGQLGWFNIDLVTTDGSTYTRRINFIKDF
jgi:subtilisin family serine protease